MDLTNSKLSVAIVYTSVSGNTEELAEMIYQIFLTWSVDAAIYRIEEFSLSDLLHYDVVAIGTYTWGNGDIPKEMRPLYNAVEFTSRKDMTTAVFGTGDSFYPMFCGAVDQFRDMLYVHTNLAATLKVELRPQRQDLQRCEKFVESLLFRAGMHGYARVNPVMRK
ncbi:flavodoxin domain-containing protein [Neobacillus sp. DY30]|uniref:flavodoxin domain-containing protein n=1 Tax=Neobacillus sp. DY30 TaxID=3047871 RepID=UPI0024BF5DE2|nr:flavodoxin domain-containing protein [Neobacillus sp. DY30]WHY02803.1 flavodoxin domain-containing protein [Neobacillus sp. DY30]